MSFQSWLRILRAAFGPNRGQRRGSPRPATTRPSLEVLEDRLTPSFTWGGDYPLDEFNQIAPNFPFASQFPGPGVAADFNGDGWQDLFSGSWPGMGDVAVGSVFLGEGDGTLVLEESWSIGGNPVQIGTGEINGDGRPDLAVYNYYSESDQSVSVFLNNGIWPNNPQLSIGGASVTEGNSGTVAAVFTVALDNGPNQPVTVNYATSDGNAMAGADYQATSGTLTFAPGETTKTITVLVNGDRIPDGDEGFSVNLSDPTNAVLVNTTAQGIILDDEPRISIGDATVAEGNTSSANATFTLTLSRPSDVDVTVHYDTANGTAVAGSDFMAASGDVTIPVGQTSATFTIAVIGDRLAEPNETFFLNLSNPNYGATTDGQGVGNIVDDEPRVSIGDVSKSEGKKNQTTLFTFTVTLSAAYDQAVTMSFKTVNGTASTSDNDYVAKAGTLTFAPGETTKTITIEVKGDSKKEANETFYLDLFGNSSNSLFTKNRGIGTILNDD